MSKTTRKQSKRAEKPSDDVIDVDCVEKKQERWCQLVACGMNEFDAYRVAYERHGEQLQYIKPRVYELKKRKNVMDRLAAIYKEHGVNYDIDREFLTRNILQALMIAKARGRPSEIRAAAMDLGKLHGLVVDRMDVNSNHTFQTMKAVEVDGTEITFDIGSGRVIEPPAKQIIDVTPRRSGGAEPPEDIENELKTDYSEPFEDDADNLEDLLP